MFDVAAFATLLRRKRGEAGLSQQQLAESVFDDPARKADISRLENGRVANPQEQTIQRLCTALGITDTEMAPIRSGLSAAEQLANIPGLTRDNLELLASRFDADRPHAQTDGALRAFLTDKAQEYRDYKAQIDALDDRVAAIANLKGAAQDAAARLDFDEVETLLSRVDEVETEIAADTKLARARNALMRGRVQQAYDILSAAADSFGSVDALAPARRRLDYSELLYSHGLRYGGSGLVLSARMIGAALDSTDRAADPLLWARAQNNLANALSHQGTRTGGPGGAALLAEAVAAYRAALEVYTRADHPVDWAMTQENLALAEESLAGHDATADPRPHLLAALDHVAAALEVYDPAHMSYDYGTATDLRDRLTARLAAL